MRTAILFSIVLQVALAHMCHVGFYNAAGKQTCSQDGCALVVEDGQIPKYACVSDYFLHDMKLCISNPDPDAQFQAAISCTCVKTERAWEFMSCQRSSCYDQNSQEKPARVNQMSGREDTMGDLLQVIGIRKFCCCRGHNCNAVNEDMAEYVGITKHHHHHHHNIAASAHNNLLPQAMHIALTMWLAFILSTN